MLKDRYDNPLSTSSQAARDAYVRGVDLLLSANAGAEAAFRTAIAADEGFAVAHSALARALQIAGRPADGRVSRERAVALAAGTTPREQSHIAIFEKILGGQGAVALEMIREHVGQWPRDAMALAPATSVFGLIGFSGKQGREEDQLALLSPLEGDYGDDWWFRTVLAFAEIELGQFARGHKNIDAALERHPRNAHAAHIRAHLYYEEGERQPGLDFLTQWARDYSREGTLHCHVSWHIALWNMEMGRMDEAWRIYSDSLHPGAAWGPQINVLTDCASFLARAEFAGAARKPELWKDLSAYAAKWFPNPGVNFADMHSALAHAMAGDGEALAKYAEQPKGPAGDMLAPIARGFSAFARNDWDGAIREIDPVLATDERMGGSRAQRDLLEYTVACAMLRAGRTQDAQRMLHAHRPQVAAGLIPVAGL
ncbi:MAG: tetratricopeptide repeat protein [Hyphomicrobiaceae bacterium]